MIARWPVLFSRGNDSERLTLRRLQHQLWLLKTLSAEISPSATCPAQMILA